MKPQKCDSFDLMLYFKQPGSQRQRQYEAVRAIVVEELPIEAVAQRFGYKITTIYSLIRDAKAGRIELFPDVKKGPQQRRTPSEVQEKIITLRKQRLSTPDIQRRLAEEGIGTSERTVERVLKDSGFGKLQRRTNRELGKTVANKILPDRAELLDFSELEPFNVDCPSVGVFFFLPYILESKILDTVTECELPGSSDIGSIQACLSMLVLKLIGCNRLSHIGAYDYEPGFGVFAGLNVLPKPTYMSTYSCRCSEIQVMDLQNKVVSALRNRHPDLYSSSFINLDSTRSLTMGMNLKWSRCGAVQKEKL